MPTSRQQRRMEAQRQIIKHFDEQIPAFKDVFDERSFYIFAAVLTVISFVAVFVLAYYCNVKIDDADELRKAREKRERKRKEKLAEKLIREKIARAEPGSDEQKDLENKLKIFLVTREWIDKEESDIEDLDVIGSNESLLKQE